MKINFYKDFKENIEIEVEENLKKDIETLKCQYMKIYNHAPDMLYCSPLGYFKLIQYNKYVSNTHYSIKDKYNLDVSIGLKSMIVPNLNKEFVVYKCDSEDYLSMIE